MRYCEVILTEKSNTGRQGDDALLVFDKVVAFKMLVHAGSQIRFIRPFFDLMKSICLKMLQARLNFSFLTFFSPSFFCFQAKKNTHQGPSSLPPTTKNHINPVSPSRARVKHKSNKSPRRIIHHAPTASPIYQSMCRRKKGCINCTRPSSGVTQHRPHLMHFISSRDASKQLCIPTWFA